MNRWVTFAICFSTAACVCAAPIDDFLDEIVRLSALTSSSNAIKQIETKLKTDGDKLSSDDRGKCDIARAELYYMIDGGTDIGDAAINAVVTNTGISAEIKIQAINAAFKKVKRIFTFQSMCETALKQPDFAKGENRGLLLEYIGDAYAKRTFFDLAYTAYRDAAKLLSSKRKLQIQCMLKAAAAAQEYRDVILAEKTLKEITALPNLEPAIINKVNLEIGLNLIRHDQYAWVSDAVSIKRAREYIDKAIAGHNGARTLSLREIAKARYALFDAEESVGNFKEAIKIGQMIVDNSQASTLEGLFCRNVEVKIGDNMVKAKDYRGAIKYYERGAVGCSVGAKTVYKRLALAARACHDFARAQQAYLDCLKYCDYVEGRDELNQLRRLAAVMGKASQGKVGAATAEDVFNNDNDEIEALSLDEM